MSEQRIRILLAEDDVNLGILLVDFLQRESYEVILCKDGVEALEAFNRKHFDLCLLDVMMPKMDGFTLAKSIRKNSQTIPIIFITAKSMKHDKLTGYDIGADDYITKPFDEEELLWKINAIIRRHSQSGKKDGERLIQLGKYIFDYTNQSLNFNGSVRRITEKECQILKYLSDHRNTVIKREELLKGIWGENDYFFGRSLDVFITKIRKYLKEDDEIQIENVFKVGFVLNVK